MGINGNIHWAMKRDGARYLRRRAMLSLPTAGWLLAIACSSGLRFEPVGLNGELDQYRSASFTRESMVEVRRLGSGLRCVVVSNPDPEKSHSGGVRIPCRQAKGCQLEMGFPDAASIVRMSVDAYNAKGERVARWETEQWPKLPHNRTTYVFVPQQRTKGFVPVASPGTGAFDAVHVYVAVQRSTGTIFDLYKAAMAR